MQEAQHARPVFDSTEDGNRHQDQPTTTNKTMTMTYWKNLTTTSCFAAGGIVAAQSLCADHVVRNVSGGTGSSG